MLKVWGRATSSNVQKVMWAIGEIGLDHERIDVGASYGGLDTEAYGKLNPNRLVPTLVDGDLVIWESNAIVRYLAAKYDAGGLWPKDPGQRALADQWMDWLPTTLLGNFVAVFFGLVRIPPEHRDMAATNKAIERLNQNYRLLDAHMAGRVFIAGDRLTMGDIPLGMTLYRYYDMAFERPSLPHVEAWYARLQERPAYREHVMVSYDALRNDIIPKKS
jgi:glutathione S-transferase